MNLKFELIPILSKMEQLYKKPISQERFQAYITALQGGTKGDLNLPIGSYNPMAKAHIDHKINELKAINAENLMKEVLHELNTKTTEQNGRTIKVVLNLADDLKGGWTNRYTTDFDSKFKLNALVTRNFCTPHFWSSENYNETLVRNRTMEYVYRTIYWITNSKPRTLEDYLNQEIYVCQQIGAVTKTKETEKFEFIEKFYTKNKSQETYDILFNFFYGDEACHSLNYPAYGIEKTNGFEYAESLTNGRN